MLDTTLNHVNNQPKKVEKEVIIKEEKGKTYIVEEPIKVVEEEKKPAKINLTIEDLKTKKKDELLDISAMAGFKEEVKYTFTKKKIIRILSKLLKL